jgi:hypothetical protein
VFAGTWQVWLLGLDAFSETGRVGCTMYLWVALQNHRVLQGYIDFDFIFHTEVSSVVVGHLIQTRVPMAMHESLKAELTSMKSSVKTQAATVEKFE